MRIGGRGKDNYMSKIYDFTVLKRDGTSFSLNELKGKVLLIVNTATGCGFTPQYEEIEALYEKYHDKGLEVLDFPCNQFKEQAKGSDEEIHSFCQLKYNTKFDQFKKVEVNGANRIELFNYLCENAPYKKPRGLKNKLAMNLLEKMSGTKETNEIRWNFTKFLVSKDGNIIKRYEPVEKVSSIEKDIKLFLE